MNCPARAASCTPPASLGGFLDAEVAAFATICDAESPASQPRHRTRNRPPLYIGVLLHVRSRRNLIRSRDLNLPPPAEVSYPVYDDSSINFLGMYNVQSSLHLAAIAKPHLPFDPPCINPLALPIPQLGAINVVINYAPRASITA